MNLLQMSFSGAAFITAVVIIRAVAINKLPKKTFLVLWELVILSCFMGIGDIKTAYPVFDSVNV